MQFGRGRGRVCIGTAERTLPWRLLTVPSGVARQRWRRHQMNLRSNPLCSLGLMFGLFLTCFRVSSTYCTYSTYSMPTDRCVSSANKVGATGDGSADYGRHRRTFRARPQTPLSGPEFGVGAASHRCRFGSHYRRSPLCLCFVNTGAFAGLDLSVICRARYMCSTHGTYKPTWPG